MILIETKLHKTRFCTGQLYNRVSVEVNKFSYLLIIPNDYNHISQVNLPKTLRGCGMGTYTVAMKSQPTRYRVGQKSREGRRS